MMMVPRSNRLVLWPRRLLQNIPGSVLALRARGHLERKHWVWGLGFGVLGFEGLGSRV